MTWKMHCYTWVANPLPPESWETGFYIGADVVNAALSRSRGTSFFAEELAGTCGLSLGTVATRLEELVLEGKVRVEEMEYASEALGPQILREEFTRALAALRRAEFHVRAARDAHIETHHDGELPLDVAHGGWACDICRDLFAYGDETMRLENILQEGETEAASHFVSAVYAATEHDGS